MKAKSTPSVGRRSVLGAAAAAFSAGAVALPRMVAQTRAQVEKAERDHSASNPGPINKAIAAETPSSMMPPGTDHGDILPIWYSFDLTHRRIQPGGWTRQVTSVELPSSTDVAGVTMRLTAGSFRELHWHTATEWSYMLYGNARVTVYNPNDGTIFIGDVSKGDLWFFPAGYPHSIQGLGPDGCEFLLVFDQGNFSEYNTFLISGWLAHTPQEVLAQNLNIPQAQLSVLPEHALYIFSGKVPGPLEEDRKAVGGAAVASKIDYTFHMLAMTPTLDTMGGTARVVDSHNFPPSTTIAAGLFDVKPGGLREMHWHPNASEWQYYIQGSAQMTVFDSAAKARTMDYHPNDVGFVPRAAGHYIKNIGTDDLRFLAIFKSNYFVEASLNQWLRRLPQPIVEQTLNLTSSQINRIPDRRNNIIPK